MSVIEFPKKPTADPSLADDRTISKSALFAWYSTAFTLVRFPGIEQKIGSEQYRDLKRMCNDLEAAIGVVRGEPDFNC